MAGIQNIIYFGIFIGVLITVHELGHFLAAKWAGVKVLKFSIGFGPKLIGFRRGDTEYQIAAFPLGGYVRMAGDLPGENPGEWSEEPVSAEDEPRSLFAAPWWKRVIISFAGPAMNLLFPIAAYFFVYLGDQQFYAPRAAYVDPAFPAATAGIKSGDLITAIEGEPIVAFEDISEALEGRFDRPIAVTVKRGDKDIVLSVSPVRSVDKESKIEPVFRGRLGVSRISPAPIVGVPADSTAFAAGLRTFDRIAAVNGAATPDLATAERLIDSASGKLKLTVLRSNVAEAGTASLIMPSSHEVEVDKLDGRVGLAALGIELGDRHVWSIEPGTAAEKLGVKRGDKVLELDGQPIGSWSWLDLKLRSIEERPFSLTWESTDGKHTATTAQYRVSMTDALGFKHTFLRLGLRPRLGLDVLPGADPLGAGGAPEIMTIHNGPVAALTAAVKEVPHAIVTILSVFKGVASGKVGADQFGGPLMAFQIAKYSAELGLDRFLQSMALVSVNLGIVNLLPIPVLDGFAILSALWVGIRGRPLSMRAREIATIVGLVVLGLFFIYVNVNDVTRFLSTQ